MFGNCIMLLSYFRVTPLMKNGNSIIKQGKSSPGNDCPGSKVSPIRATPLKVLHPGGSGVTEKFAGLFNPNLIWLLHEYFNAGAF